MKSILLSFLAICALLISGSHPAAASCPFPHRAKEISCDHGNPGKLRVQGRCFLPCEREGSLSCTHEDILTCELPDDEVSDAEFACSCPGCKSAVVVSPGGKHTEELVCESGQRIVLQSLFMHAKSSNPVSDPDVEVHVEPRTGPPIPEWHSHYTDCWQRDPKEPYLHQNEYLRAVFACRNSFFDCRISQIVHYECEDLPTPAPTPDTPTPAPTPDTPVPTETKDPARGGDGEKGGGDSDSSMALAIGIGIGAGLVGIGLIALAVYFLCFRKQQAAGPDTLYNAQDPLIQN